MKTQVPKAVSGIKEKKNNNDQGAKTGGSGKVFARQEVFTVNESNEEEKAKGPSLVAGMILILVFYVSSFYMMIGVNIEFLEYRL